MQALAGLDRIVERIAGGFSPQRIILFGSRARGDARADSDFDLLVLFREVENPHARAAEMYAGPADCGVAKDLVVSTVARFERYKNVVNTVHWPAAREGRVLYAVDLRYADDWREPQRVDALRALGMAEAVRTRVRQALQPDALNAA